MANVVLNPGTGGNTVETETVSGAERQVIRIGGASASDKAAVTAANGLAVDVTQVQGIVTTEVEGTVTTADALVVPELENGRYAHPVVSPELANILSEQTLLLREIRDLLMVLVS